MKLNRRNFNSFLLSSSLFSLYPNLSIANKLRNKLLILIELQGANDGLNTVIPYSNKFYYKLRPNIAIKKDDGVTAEVTRCCVLNDAPKGSCSFLYACCWRAWRAMGGQRMITYTLQSESGASLRGAGWKVLHEVVINKGKGWTNRPGREWQPVTGQLKFRWEKKAN